MTTNLIETMARAYYAACPHAVQAYSGGQYRYKDWAEIGDGERQNARNGILAALAVVEAAGYRIVPVEPTWPMLIPIVALAVAGPDGDEMVGDAEKDVYAGILAAAPKVT